MDSNIALITNLDANLNIDLSAELNADLSADFYCWPIWILLQLLIQFDCWFELWFYTSFNTNPAASPAADMQYTNWDFPLPILLFVSHILKNLTILPSCTLHPHTLYNVLNILSCLMKDIISSYNFLAYCIPYTLALNNFLLAWFDDWICWVNSSEPCSRFLFEFCWVIL